MKKFCSAILISGLGFAAIGCGRSEQGIRQMGSDTMVNVALAWSEAYHAKHPDARINVTGGGSGGGIAALTDGKCDMCNASRDITAEENKKIEAKRGKPAKLSIVGYDCLAIFVHKNNPLDEITVEQLADIFSEGGKIDKWSQLNVDSKKVGNDAITRVGRQNSSGTYAYFQEFILHKKNYKSDTLSLDGSKDVVGNIATNPAAIGYSGMGYATKDVKMLKVIGKKGPQAPSVENAKNGNYPITRSLNIYTVGEPTGKVKDYLQWILGPEGQAIIEKEGFVPR